MKAPLIPLRLTKLLDVAHKQTSALFTAHHSLPEPPDFPIQRLPASSRTGTTRARLRSGFDLRAGPRVEATRSSVPACTMRIRHAQTHPRPNTSSRPLRHTAGHEGEPFPPLQAQTARAPSLSSPSPAGRAARKDMIRGSRESRVD